MGRIHGQTMTGMVQRPVTTGRLLLRHMPRERLRQWDMPTGGGHLVTAGLIRHRENSPIHNTQTRLRRPPTIDTARIMQSNGHTILA
jgi:hypothetical protein